MPSDRPKTTGWQPISTAPKDGTQLLLYDATLTWFDWDAEDEPEFPRPQFVGWWKEHELGGRWQLVHYDAFNYDPTHWMPLPEPPHAK